ncbi:hypothetical protein L1887_47191 [Cichorium endivia]|nr:hypothetical protein L1887_47191 [Cichorium endivia]
MAASSASTLLCGPSHCARFFRSDCFATTPKYDQFSGISTHVKSVDVECILAGSESVQVGRATCNLVKAGGSNEVSESSPLRGGCDVGLASRSGFVMCKDAAVCCHMRRDSGVGLEAVERLIERAQGGRRRFFFLGWSPNGNLAFFACSCTSAASQEKCQTPRASASLSLAALWPGRALGSSCDA